MVESLRLQPLQPTKGESNGKEVDRSEEVKKKIDSLTPQMAEQRYNYLQSKPIGELTDAEYDERLALASSTSRKPQAEQ